VGGPLPRRPVRRRAPGPSDSPGRGRWHLERRQQGPPLSVCIPVVVGAASTQLPSAPSCGQQRRRRRYGGPACAVPARRLAAVRPDPGRRAGPTESPGGAPARQGRHGACSRDHDLRGRDLGHRSRCARRGLSPDQHHRHDPDPGRCSVPSRRCEPERGVPRRGSRITGCAGADDHQDDHCHGPFAPVSTGRSSSSSSSRLWRSSRL
jgi:hypothetical protein